MVGPPLLRWLKEEPFAQNRISPVSILIPSPYLSEEDQQGEDARKATHGRARKGCTRSSLDKRTRSEKQTLAANETKKKENREKAIEKNVRVLQSIKSYREIDAKQKERQGTTSRGPYCCYLVHCVA